jgi:hypothetical protein
MGGKVSGNRPINVYFRRRREKGGGGGWVNVVADALAYMWMAKFTKWRIIVSFILVVIVGSSAVCVRVVIGRGC